MPSRLAASFFRLFVLSLLFLFFGAEVSLAVPPRGRPENSVSWALYKEGEGPNRCGRKTPGSQSLGANKASGNFKNHQSCAGFGELYFDIDARLGACDPIASGDDVPGSVTPPASMVSDGWQPCDLGECLSDIPTTPWVGVIDWGNEHGWQVAHTIQQASMLSSESQPVEVRLFDVSQSNIPAIADLPWVTDAHVLEQLCTFSELTRISSEDDRVASPLALNMSFGRLDTEIDVDPEEWNFARLVKLVLRHLRKEGDILEVAAAGNHDQLEYPAALKGVVSAGWFDPVVAQTTGEFAPGKHSPADAQALTLSYGLVLEPEEQENNEDPQHFVPTFGSSFSAALVTGWLAGWQNSCDLQDPHCDGGVRQALSGGKALQLWPVDILDDDDVVVDTQWQFAIEGEAIAGSASSSFELLAERSLGGVPADWAEPSTASDPGSEVPVFHLKLVAVDLDTFEGPALSVADLVKFEKYGPSPGARGMCRPCHRRDDAQEVRLAFGDIQALPDNLYLEDVLVEIGEKLYTLTPPDSNPGLYYDFIDALQFGESAEVSIENFPVNDGASMGLRFHLIRTEDGVSFWDHEPIWTTTDG